MKINSLPSALHAMQHVSEKPTALVFFRSPGGDRVLIRTWLIFGKTGHVLYLHQPSQVAKQLINVTTVHTEANTFISPFHCL